MEPLKAKNRRATNRYAVRTPLQYRAADTAPHSVWKHGRTLDMSANGILIDIPETIPVGSTLELTMDWPGIYHGRTVVRLFLTAAVAGSEERGTSLRILSHQFRDARRAIVHPLRPERNLSVA